MIDMCLAPEDHRG
jgi:hypothetical protein